MSNWRKENKLRLKVTYSLDKYKESDDYNSQMETVEGEMTYVNMPFANSFLNMELDDGNIVSIAYPLVLTIHWIDMPKWTKLTESQVVDSATMRLKNLDNELEVQKNTFNQEDRLKKSKDKGVN
jgi:hypothetical protein|tara:strand:- start:407 stop:778 length:372 start_codon:yes stop_codon:yes gene_type:complete